MRTRVTFDGHDLTALARVSDLRTSVLARDVRCEDVDGRDGSVYTGASLSARRITLTLSLLGVDMEERRERARELAAILNVPEPRPLCLSVDGGRYYMAVPSTGETTRIRPAADSFDVEFTVPDPVARGETRTVTVPSGGSVTFDVGGTYPTRPRISAAAAKNGSGGFWRLRLEDGSYLLATIPSGVSSAPVVADCEARTLRVNNFVALLVPDADWLVLEPGTHTLEMTGTGAATVTFEERWL